MSFVIHLRNRKKEVVGAAIVDDCDRHKVEGHSWCLIANGYAISRINKKCIYLHRLVMCSPPSQVDHRNRNKLDCRRENLRLATDSQNKQNVPARNGFRGVYLESKTNKWRTTFANRRGSRKAFLTQEEAAKFIEEWRYKNLEFAECELGRVS